MNIIQLQIEDIKKALDLVWLVFYEFEAPDYSEQGIDTFKDFIQYNSVIKKIQSGELFFWGCFLDSELVGVVATRGINHICLLFVKKEHQRKGIARRLFNTVVENCRACEAVKKITANSSPYAIEAYHHLGFEDTDKERIVEGIRFTSMEYTLNK